AGEALAEFEVALGRVEDAADDELRRDRAVPTILLQAERDVVAAHTAEAVEVRAEAERDRRAELTVAVPDPEAEVLAVADRGRLHDLAAGHEQRRRGIAQSER